MLGFKKRPVDPSRQFRTWLLRARRMVGRVDWRAPGFTQEKALVCAAFSKIAYLHVTEFEVDRRQRAKAVPCGGVSGHRQAPALDRTSPPFCDASLRV
jgi:hypothetical protein